MTVTPTMTLLQLCSESPTLAHHPDVAVALVNKNVEKILEHLRRQRVWLSSLYARRDRDRLEVRNGVVINHAKAAVIILRRYEQLVRAA